MSITHPDYPRFCIAHAALGQTYILDLDDAKHLKVLRRETGDVVHVTDGAGRLFEGQIRVEKRQTQVTITTLCEDQSEVPRKQVVLAVAPTKNTGRLEWLIEKAAEIGVDAIVPVITEHSERVHLKTDRLERIATSALKQSKALFSMRVEAAMGYRELLSLEGFAEKWIAHCRVDARKTSLATFVAQSKKGDVLIAIGPEGDFSASEVSEALADGWQSLDLGPKRLRTETAALTAVIAAVILRS